MLTNPTPSRRLAGKVVILGALAVALPLTATWATQYVDVAAPTPPTPPSPASAPEAPQAPLAPLPAGGALAPLAPIPPLPPIRNGKVTTDGQERDWSQLTPAEKARARASLDEARRELATHRADRATYRADRATFRADRATFRADRQAAMVDSITLRRDLETARRDVEEAMREIDRNAAELRKAGHDPETLKATVRASLKAVEAIDIDAITRRAMAGIDPALIERSLAAAEAGIARAQAEIDAADRHN